MAIRQKSDFDGNIFHGYVSHGSSDKHLAKEALVFMVVAINSHWKLPIGYFLIAGLGATEKKKLFIQCLDQLNEINANVISLTFDGARSNISMAKQLGSQIYYDTETHINNISESSLKPSFIHCGKKIRIIYDACHAIKLVRGALAEKGPFIDNEDNEISWHFIVQLEKLQESEGVHLGNKLRKAHVNFFKQKMKVRLAVQVLSQSVADALKFCRDVFKNKIFENCGATIQFIEIINKIFDILNSRFPGARNWKRAIMNNNYDEIFKFAHSAITYLKHLKFPNGNYLVLSERKAGFIGLIIGLTNSLELYLEYFSKNNIIHYLHTYRLSQDHLELLFSTIRSKGGFNNNPSARQFNAAYKRIVVHVQLSERGVGNCMPQESVPILHTSAIQKDRRCDEPIPNNEEYEMERNLDFILENQNISEFVSEVLIYIAGFVIHSLKPRIQCEICLEALLGERNDLLCSLVEYKSRGKLIYPSKYVITVCRESEKQLRGSLHNKKQSQYMTKLCNSIYKSVVENNILSPFSTHDFETGPIDGHISILTKNIINKFCTLRFRHECFKECQQLSNRQLLSKLILFQGN